MLQSDQLWFPSVRKSALQNCVHGHFPRAYRPPPRPSDGRRALVLDLDETLIHTSSCPPSCLTEYVRMPCGCYLLLRPGLKGFLEYAMKRFETFIYTLAERAYAEPIVRIIAPALPASHLLCRDACGVRGGRIFKDLEMLGRNLHNVIMVDDDHRTAACWQRNTLIVSPWTADPCDAALTASVPAVLEKCRRAENVQDVLGDWKTQFAFRP